jgi:hypothetical protein
VGNRDWCRYLGTAQALALPRALAAAIDATLPAEDVVVRSAVEVVGTGSGAEAVIPTPSSEEVAPTVRAKDVVACVADENVVVRATGGTLGLIEAVEASAPSASSVHVDDDRHVLTAIRDDVAA